MSRPITISIPKPCHENWQEMTATERGGFCKSCQKEVIDFTKKTEDETHRILSAGGATCGRFRTDQLERPIHQTTYIRSWWHWKAIAASVLSLVGYKEGVANSKFFPGETKIDTFQRRTEIQDKMITISGKVVDEDFTAIINAPLILEDSLSNNVAILTTDTNGHFEYQTITTNCPTFIRTGLSRYTTQLITINPNDDNNLQIQLQKIEIADVVLNLPNPTHQALYQEEFSRGIMGGITILKPRHKIRNFFRRIFHKLNN